MAMTKAYGYPIAPNLICAGRTDQGVHALGQVVNVVGTVTRDTRSFLHAVNQSVDNTIRVRWVKPVLYRISCPVQCTGKALPIPVQREQLRVAVIEKKSYAHA